MTAGDLQSASKGPLAIRIGKWADQLLGPYLARHPNNPHKEPKQLHDAISGIVNLHPWEVFLLDSPFLQRLRYVRQLGVGHFLFPTSGYSRFEHSLGALATAFRMFEFVRTAPQPGMAAAGPIYRDDAFEARCDVVRMAALLHDVGHCIFSHVSERFYGRSADVDEVVNDFSAFYQTKISPSEAISLLILRTDAFLRLLRVAEPRRIEFNEASIIEKICACVAGSKFRMAPDCFMAEIINGPVDCDKLDYLGRDAHMAGVPISLDIDRLLSKLRLVRARGKDDKELFSLAIVPSGARAIDELLVSRIFLYDKFYYHAKVMAAEELIRRALHFLSKAYPALGDPASLLGFGDDEFLALDDVALRARFGVSANSGALRTGCELLVRARNRDLPRRAFAFARRYLPELPEVLARIESRGKPEPVTQGLYEFLALSRILDTPHGKDNHVEIIRSYAKEIGADTEAFMAVQSVQRAAGSIYLPVVLPDGTIEEKPSFLFKTSEWTEAYALNKQTSYVFCYDGFEKIHLAAERAFAEAGDLTFAPNCSTMAKISRDRLLEERRKLPDSWIAYRLAPDFLTSAEGVRRIERQRTRLASFLNALHPRYGPQLVHSWVFQFPDADLRESALSFIEHLTYVEPAAIVRGFGKIAVENGLEKALWIPLRARGGHGKSGDVLTHDLKDLAVPMRSIAATDGSAVRDAGAVVFFDDSLNSGVQSSCLLSSWFGSEAPCESPSDKDPDGPLGQELQEALRAVPISFVFYARHPTGEQRVRACCQALGLDAKQVASVIDSSRPEFRVEGFAGSSKTSRERFVDFLRRRGAALLEGKVLANEPGWTKQRAADYALGYGPLDLTLVFRHSVSASTPVALWMMSATEVDTWAPLFPRKRTEFLRAVGADADADANAPDDPLEGSID